ncbi:MAG: hypothetical protein ABIW48_09670 [Burkholderiales bacterium]
MEQHHNRTAKTTVAFDGTLLAVDKAYWSAGGANWNSTSKLQELQATAKQKLGLGASINAWIAYMADPGLCMKVRDWLIERQDTPPDGANKNENVAVIVTAEARIFLLSGWYSMVKVDTVPFAEGAVQEGALGAMLAGAKAPMGLALIARRSAWVVAGIDYVNIENGEFGGIRFEQRFIEQKML